MKQSANPVRLRNVTRLALIEIVVAAVLFVVMGIGAVSFQLDFNSDSTEVLQRSARSFASMTAQDTAFRDDFLKFRAIMADLLPRWQRQGVTGKSAISFESSTGRNVSVAISYWFETNNQLLVCGNSGGVIYTYNYKFDCPKSIDTSCLEGGDGWFAQAFYGRKLISCVAPIAISTP